MFKAGISKGYANFGCIDAFIKKRKQIPIKRTLGWRANTRFTCELPVFCRKRSQTKKEKNVCLSFLHFGGGPVSCNAVLVGRPVCWIELYGRFRRRIQVGSGTLEAKWLQSRGRSKWSLAKVRWCGGFFLVFFVSFRFNMLCHLIEHSGDSLVAILPFASFPSFILDLLLP